MTRSPCVAGNWKMNKTVSEAREFTAGLLPELRATTGVEIVLCPPFTALFPVAAILQGSGIGIGAQDLYWESKGAYTGEIAANMIAEFCQYVIIGHSERRSHFQETDEQVNRKIKAAANSGLIASRKPRATPPNAAWASPEPAKAIPRRTTNTPMDEQVTPTMTDPSRALCMNP